MATKFFNKKILIALFLIFSIASLASCSGGDSEQSDSLDQSDSVMNLPPTADKNDGQTSDKGDHIFIPIENNGSSSPSLAVTQDELDASLLQITQDLGEEHIKKYYFICDSAIYGLKSLGMLSDGRDTDRVLTGISSSISLSSGKDALVYLPKTDSFMAVADAVLTIAPEYLLVSVGTDELIKRPEISETDFYNAYRELIASIREASPSTVVVCMPILPGSDGDGLNIYKAETFNKYIHASAAEFGAYFIDIASAFSNSSGYLRIDCDAGASCLNTTGLKRLIELLRTYKIKITPEE